MNRRKFLSVIGGVVVSVSGCLGKGDAPSSTDSRTPSSESSPIVDSEVEIPPCPEKPDSLTRESAVQFATQFEKAYLTRRTLREQSEEITSIRVSIEDPDVSQTDDGWLIRFTVIGPAYRYRPTSNATETAHVDPRATTAHYLVTDQTVFRAISLDEVNPREQGTSVQCPPE